MAKPFILVQLSDPHIGATWAQSDPADAWSAAIASVSSLPDPPDAVLVTGDLAEHAADSEYAFAKSALARLDAPAYVLPGNHDDRGRLRDNFGLTGRADEPAHYAIDLGPLRLLALDTSKPGVAAGDLGQEQLAWLDSHLGAAPTTPAVVAMHHPPFLTGMPAWDDIGLPAEDRRTLADTVRRHPQVCGILAGHVHRAIVGEVGGRVALIAPSTYVQGRPRFDGTDLEFVNDPPGFAVHSLHDSELVSYVQTFDPAVLVSRNRAR